VGGLKFSAFSGQLSAFLNRISGFELLEVPKRSFGPYLRSQAGAWEREGKTGFSPKTEDQN